MGDSDRWNSGTDGANDAHQTDGRTESEPNVERNSADPNTDSGGLGRRELLAAGGLAAAGGAWYVFFRDGGDQSGPVAVSEQSWQYWKDGDGDAYRNTFHSQSPEREESYWNDDSYWADFGPGADVTVELVSSDIVEETTDRAVVKEVYRWNGPDAQAEEVTTNVELRVENGEWKVWSVEFVSSDPVDEST